MDRLISSFFRKKGIQNTDELCLSKSKAPSKVKRHLLSYIVNDVKKRATRDGNSNVTQMAQGAQQDSFFL